MKVFQILNGRCHWQTPFKSLAETVGRFPADCIFVEAPDYVNEQWGFDETEIGDDRFIKPVPPEGFIYDDETGQMYPIEMLGQLLDEAKAAKQNENNAKLANYLDNHPLTWSDGKEYGVTMEDQNEIAMNLLSYEMAVQANQAALSANPEAVVVEPVLEWHARHEACVPWTYENMVLLSITIRQYIYQWYTLNQAYKTRIYSRESVKDVQAIDIQYTDENVTAMQNGTLFPADEETTEGTEGETSGETTESTDTETDSSTTTEPEVTEPSEPSTEGTTEGTETQQ